MNRASYGKTYGKINLARLCNKFKFNIITLYSTLFNLDSYIVYRMWYVENLLDFLICPILSQLYY